MFNGTPLRHFTPYPTPSLAGVNVFNQDFTRFDGVIINANVFPPISMMPPVTSLPVVTENGNVHGRVMFVLFTFLVANGEGDVIQVKLLN